MTKSLRIGLIMQGGRDWVGGTEYIKNIIFALSSLPSNIRSTFELSLICNQNLDSKEYSQISPYLDNIFYEEAALNPFTLANRLRWKLQRTFFRKDNPRFEDFIRKNSIDFVYPYFSKSGNSASYRSAAWIYDFQHKYLTEFFTEKDIADRNELMERIAENASTVVLSSKTAQSDFQEFFPNAAHKSQILSFKTSLNSKFFEVNSLQTQKEYHLPDRFFIVSNQFWQHKNHLVVFKALNILHQQSIYPNIVCTGYIYDGRKPEHSNTIFQTIHKLGISKQVYLLGLIPRFDQIQLMRHSLAVIQPSLFEGWSTVVEDARCLGKPIILSDIPVHLEQSPPKSLFFERNSPEGLAALLADWWESLSPGVDSQQEANAIKNNLNEVQTFGYRFLEIATGSSTAIVVNR